VTDDLSQLSLFGRRRVVAPGAAGSPLPSAPARGSTQSQELERVSSRIGAAILEFCRGRSGETFHADELRQHVWRCVGSTAPGSADRILRDLRQRGLVRYVVVSRRDSLYRVEGFGGPY